MKIFTRAELRSIAERAVDCTESYALYPTWKRAYEDLIDSADRLDAMIARCEAAGINMEVE